jgi:integrase
MQAGGERRYIAPLLHHFKETLIDDIDQAAIDAAGEVILPNATAATRNRQIYTPVSAVLHHAGSERRIRRPKGWRGQRSTSWLEPEQAFALFAAADALDREFGLLLRVLTYTGMRISEALNITMRDVRLDRALVYLPETKNGNPRAVHLPPVLVAALAEQPPRPAREGGRAQTSAGVPFMARPPAERLFRFTRSGFLNALLKEAMKACGLSFPKRQGGFHLFCHTYGSWMHHFAGLDTFGLTRTGRWKDPQSADRYNHTMASPEAQRADALPTPKRIKRGITP